VEKPLDCTVYEPICEIHRCQKVLTQYNGGYTGWDCPKCTEEEKERIHRAIESQNSNHTELAVARSCVVFAACNYSDGKILTEETESIDRPLAVLLKAVKEYRIAVAEDEQGQVIT